MGDQANKKRKVDLENRQFNTQWELDYFFVLPTRENAKPTCTICLETVGLIKSGNLKRHYTTKHGSYDKKYPRDSEERRKKVASLKESFIKGQKCMRRALTMQEKSTIASLQVCWILAKRKQPFQSSEIVKECLVQVAETLFEDNKDVIDNVKSIPLSDSTNSRRVEVLAHDVKSNLKSDLNAADCFSLALDESTDVTDMAQLSIFVRFFKNGVFIENLLDLVPLKLNTKGEDIFCALQKVLTAYELPWNKLISVVTDGAPAMLGTNKGLVSFIKKQNPRVMFCHCIIHQSVLCSKLSIELTQVMDNITKAVNYIREKSSLQHRQFREFLKEAGADSRDLLLHNNVRWLSKGSVLKRFFDINKEIRDFLVQLNQTSDKHIKILSFIDDQEGMIRAAFLADVFGHINEMNKSLQGQQKNISDLLEEINEFTANLEMFIADIEDDLLHFPTLASYMEQENATFDDSNKLFCVNFLKKLQTEFEERLQDFKYYDELFKFVKRPFSTDLRGRWSLLATQVCIGVDRAHLQLELSKLKTSVEHAREVGPSFWCELDSV